MALTNLARFAIIAAFLVMNLLSAVFNARAKTVPLIVLNVTVYKDFTTTAFIQIVYPVLIIVVLVRILDLIALIVLGFLGISLFLSVLVFRTIPMMDLILTVLNAIINVAVTV